jgi:hypothetical protein
MPAYTHAQLMTGGGYTVQGQVNAIVGASGANGYTLLNGGNPSGILSTGGGYAVQSGTYFIQPQANNGGTGGNDDTGGGGGGGGGGPGNTYTNPTPSTNLPPSGLSIATTSTPRCDTVVLYVPKTPIKLGSKKNIPDDVRKLQSFLNGFEGFHLVLDGVYKRVDFNAVVTFQERHAVDILVPVQLTKGSGYVSVSTLGYLSRLALQKCSKTLIVRASTTKIIPNYCPYFKTPLRIGDTGEEVGRMQTFLAVRTNTTTNIHTNIFDAITRDTVKVFQNMFASEILTPAGFRRATGMWYHYTINKANQLLGCQ